MRFLIHVGAKISYRLIALAHMSRYYVYTIFGQREQVHGVRVILTRNNKVVLVKHWYAPLAWTLPGGGVGLRENCEDAAKREALEETGYRVNSLDFELGTYIGRMGKSDIVKVYVSSDYEGELKLIPNIEIMQRGIFSLDNLPETLSPANRRRVEAYRRGVQSETGAW